MEIEDANWVENVCSSMLFCTRIPQIGVSSLAKISRLHVFLSPSLSPCMEIESAGGLKNGAQYAMMCSTYVKITMKTLP